MQLITKTEWNMLWIWHHMDRNFFFLSIDGYNLHNLLHKFHANKNVLMITWDHMKNMWLVLNYYD